MAVGVNDDHISRWRALSAVNGLGLTHSDLDALRRRTGANCELSAE